MTKWNKVFAVPGGRRVVEDFADGNLSVESVQKYFRNVHSDASGIVRKVIRLQGAKKSRKLARRAIGRRKNLLV